MQGRLRSALLLQDMDECCKRKFRIFWAAGELATHNEDQFLKLSVRDWNWLNRKGDCCRWSQYMLPGSTEQLRCPTFEVLTLQAQNQSACLLSFGGWHKTKMKSDIESIMESLTSHISLWAVHVHNHLITSLAVYSCLAGGEQDVRKGITADSGARHCVHRNADLNCNTSVTSIARGFHLGLHCCVTSA